MFFRGVAAAVLLAMWAPGVALAGPFFPVWLTKTPTDSMGGYPDVKDIEADGAGNLLVASGVNSSGSGSGSIQKLSADGVVLWKVDVGDAYGTLACPSRIALDSSGNIYIAGTIRGDSLFFSKLTSSGTLVWSSTITSTGFIGSAIGVSGNTLVVGADKNFGDRHGVVIAGNLNGIVSWTRSTTAITDLEVDGAGDVLISAVGNGAPGSGYCSWITKWTGTTGVTQWSTTVIGDGQIALGGDGYIYMTGDRPAGDRSASLGVIARFNSTTGAMVDYGGVQASLWPGYQSASFGVVPSDVAVLPDGTIVASFNDANPGPTSPVDKYTGITAMSTDLVSSCDVCPGKAWNPKWTQVEFHPPVPGGADLTLGPLKAGANGRIYTGVAIDPGEANMSLQISRGVVALANGTAAKPVSKGKLEVRQNIIHVKDGDKAIIILKGDPNGKVWLAAMGTSGYAVTRIRSTMNCPACPTESNKWYTLLDANGEAVVYWDGKMDGVSTLADGVYWIAASGGGISDRKQVMVITGN